MTALNLKRNSAFNLLGGVVPAVAALAVVPFIVHGLGAERYGLLVLVTSILGYFAILDVNITAGSTKYLAEYHQRGDVSRVNQTVSFGLVVYLGIGITGCAILYALSDWLVREVFRVSPAELPLAAECLRIAAIGFLFGQLQVYLQSIPQALLRYDLTARFEMAFGLIVPLGSVLLLQLGHGLVAIVWLRVLLSLVNAALLARTVLSLLPALRWQPPQRDILVGMGQFSAYAFLSRVAALSYAHGDKLIIGAVVGMKPLAIYAVAATVGNRVLGLMYRVSAVLFPAASALAASGDESRLRAVYLRLSRYVIFVNLSALLLIGVFADPLLRAWIGADYAAGGALVLQLVAAGQFVDSLTNLPSLVNDGRGHPRVSGLFAITRAVLGLAAVYGMVHQFGITGAAGAHLLSALVMTAAFVHYVHGRTVPVSLGELVRQGWAVPMVGASVIGVVVAVLFDHLDGSRASVIALVGAAAVLLAAYGWYAVLLAEDRGRLQHWLRRRPRGTS